MRLHQLWLLEPGKEPRALTANAEVMHNFGGWSPDGTRLAFYAGVTWIVWLPWLAGMVAGIVLAAALPSSGRLAYLGILAMLALVAPMLRGAPAWAAALAAGTVGLAGAGWPWKLGLIAAVFAGLVAGLAVESRQKDREARP